MEWNPNDKTENMAQSTGGATTAGGMTHVAQGPTGVVERSHIDESKDIVQSTGGVTTAGGMMQVAQGVMERSRIDDSKNIAQSTAGATTVVQGSKCVMERSHIDKPKYGDKRSLQELEKAWLAGA